MAMFGSSWNDDDYDDGPIGISSSMKEDLRREQETISSSSNGLGRIGFHPLNTSSNLVGDTITMLG
jgi:hypothetical protein